MSDKKDKWPDELCHILARDRLGRYIQILRTPDITHWYKVADTQKKLLIRMANEDMRNMVIAEALCAEHGEAVPGHVVAKIVTFAKLYMPTLPETPQPFAWRAEDVWTLSKLDFEPTKGPHPAWDEFLTRLSDPMAFMAFIWSCFEKQNKSRQILWLYGQNGEDGKSTVYRVLGNILKEGATSISNIAFKGESRFTLSSVYDKRVIFYPDCRNAKICMYELTRMMTSGDLVNVEFKGQGFQPVVMQAKLCIAANIPPDITGGNADKSRLIRIDVQPNTIPDAASLWEDRLMQEFRYFAYSCREAYAQICPHHGKIMVSSVTTELVQDSAAEYDDKWAVFFERNFLLQPNAILDSSEVLYYCRLDGMRDLDVGDFKHWLSRMGVKTKRTQVNGIQKVRYYGVTTKENGQKP